MTLMHETCHVTHFSDCFSTLRLLISNRKIIIVNYILAIKKIVVKF